MPSAPPDQVSAPGGRRPRVLARCRARTAVLLAVALTVAVAGAALAQAPAKRSRSEIRPTLRPVAVDAPGGRSPQLSLTFPLRTAGPSPAAAGPSPPVHRGPLAPRGPIAAGPPPALQATGPFPRSGPGTFAVEPTRGPPLGTAGRLRRFQVAVERGTPERLSDFAATVDQVLGDPRSWIAGRQLRLRRVPAGAPHDFTIYLVTPGTAGRMCARGGVDIRVGGEPFTSCRAGDAVVINLARWRLSAPPYVARRVPLSVYRQYVINHEVGHALGNGHVRCPGAGRAAPVMMQQTLGLGTCRPNVWPYLNGHRYSGPPM